MELRDVIAKIVAGEELTDEEKKYLADWKDDGRIPKSRLDQEIQKRKDAEGRGSELSEKVDELTAQIEELKNAGLTDAEKAKNEFSKQLGKLQKELEAASKQRDETAKELENLKFNAAVGEIAKKYGFSDSDYLGYRLRSADIAIDDESGVSGFIRSLEQSSPQLFTSSARSGGGTASGHQTSTIDAAKARLVELGGKAQLSSRELAEVVELTEKVSSQAQ